MCVHSLCDIVFHAVTHYEFDANLIRSGIIHERCERVPAIMGKMFHVELVYLDTFLSSGIVRSAGDTRMSGDLTILIRFRIKAGKPVNQQRDGVCRYQPSYRQQFSH